ncbi:carboxypeptidase-like regulatory domain-containing protein [Pontibacter sp. SGAir0037]|uniref:TonB-dependent receptor n=1 Tax=Pontibacter sp. SGAir0037 TaxID=2571030 RepID=UPI0010CD0A01|nr:carboxypeptidase-like regulatory domain-containing protein [Pontibacter sp. SGAir0037]QCR21626.1 hypothetical protein C1N53_04210 [Pontibacter sp. SGAir0037]
MRNKYPFLALLPLLLLLCHTTVAQTRGAITGIVLSADTQEPLADVMLQLQGTDRWAISNTDGQFRFEGVPYGEAVLQAKRIGYATKLHTLQFSQPETQVTVQLEVNSLALKEVQITATEAKVGSTSMIERKAIEHVQPTNLADVLQLLPGQLATNPNLSVAQQALLRQAPTSDPEAARMNALGTAIVLDNVPLSNNANLQSNVTILNSGPTALPPFSSVAGRGMDLRQIPAENIESVEVIRGIPSARHGDLTSGAVLVNTRAGAFRPQLRGRFNPQMIQTAFGAGFKLGDRDILNIEADLTTAQDEVRNPTERYQRLSTDLKWTRFWLPERQLSTTTKLMLYGTLDQQKQDPNDLRYQTRHYANDRGLLLSSNGRWQVGTGWLQQVQYTLSGSYSQQDSYFQDLVTRDIFPVTDAMHNTTKVARYGESEYLNTTSVSGKPLNLYGRLELNAVRELLGTRHRLSLGSEWRTDANFGDGRQFDPTRPPRQNYSAGDRPRSYREVPPLHQLAFYLEDQISGSMLNKNYLLQIGLRHDNIVHYGRVLAPRLNASLEILPAIWLRAGHGLTSKAPPLQFLYPGNRYFDFVNFNYYARNPAERLVVMTTYVIEPQTRHFTSATSAKNEVGLDFRRGDWSGTVTFFSEKLRNGYGMRRELLGFIMPVLYAVETPEGQPPVLAVDPNRKQEAFGAYDTSANTGNSNNTGIEYSLNIPEIRAIRTSFNINGAWLRTNSFDSGEFPDFNRVLSASNQNPERVPVYRTGRDVVSERLNTSVRLIHRIPELRFVFSALAQTIWIDRNKSNDLSPYPVAYIKPGGEVVKLSPEEAMQDEYTNLRRGIGITYSTWEKQPPLWLFNVRLTKEWGKGYGFSFYANNFVAHRPYYQSPRTNTFSQRNPVLFFGSELHITL